MTSGDEKSLEFLEASVKNFRILIDACSLLDEHADSFWNHVTPILEREGKTIVVPLLVYKEVEKFAKNPECCAGKSDGLNRRAKTALNTIAKLQKAGIVEIFGDKDDKFADNVFQTVFTRYRLKFNLMLITQDHDLASDILRLKESKSVTTRKRILVERINSRGYLSEFCFSGPQPPTKQYPSRSSENKTGIPDDERFARATSVSNVTGELTVFDVPKEGTVLYAERSGQRKRVKLGAVVSSGGEGTIYSTDLPGVVAKIYKPEKLNRAKFEKLKLMLSKSIHCEGVCFPTDLLYNQRNEFVGYIMKQARGKELQRCVFIPPLLRKYFPNWTKTDTATLCVTILKKLKYLHDRNVILGDINPNNILIVSPTEVYFVDTDSYQIEGFPCPVGTINYTAPEIQRKDFSSFLRTSENEYFAVATLLFMIMLPGKPPYSLQGGADQVDNIIKGDFAYASGERSTGKAPEGMWRFCWSHLPRYLKDDFYETFRKGGEHNAPEKRYSTTDWLKKFENYVRLLESGKLAEQDAMSMEIFPTRLKKNPNATYVTCRICGNEVPEERTREGICQSCLKQGEVYYCDRCGREMIYTNYQKYVKHSSRYKLCKDCSDKRNMVYTTITCVECGQNFDITNGEKEFFDSRGYELPKRCKNCRGQRTSDQNYAEPPTHIDSNTHDSNSDNAAQGRKKGRCFITTAACEYFGKPDDCYELTVLRQFRDNWLALQPGGEASINEYYRTAPYIVERLESESAERQDSVYRDIWSSYIEPCVRLIEQKAYEPCRALYETMVSSLKETLLR